MYKVFEFFNKMCIDKEAQLRNITIESEMKTFRLHEEKVTRKPV